jgi:hypothetical protein
MLFWKKILLVIVIGLIYGLIVLKINSFLFPKISEKSITQTNTVFKTDTIYIRQIDSIPFIPITKQNTSIKNVIIKSPIISNKDSIANVSTKLYKGKRIFEKLKAELKYEIYADSLYGTSFQLEINEKNIINTSTTTIEKILPIKSKFFWGGGINYGNKNIQSAELGIMYSYKQKWMAGFVINQQLNNSLNQKAITTIGARIYIPL